MQRKVTHKCPGNLYQLDKTIFEELECEEIEVPSNLQMYKNLAVYDFESYCNPQHNLQNTIHSTWQGTHVPICVSVASNLQVDQTFILNADPLVLVR